MYSVTQRIRKVKQPYGGYIPRKKFRIIQIDDKRELNNNENIHGILIGVVVDYMSRFIMGTSIEKAFFNIFKRCWNIGYFYKW